MQPDTERQLARFILETPLSAVAPSALQTVRQVLMAVVGTGLAGAEEEGIAALRGLLRDRGGKPEADTLVFGERLPATSAALINAAMCRALDYCDAMAPGPHFGSAIVPAGFAVAQSMGGCSGEAMLAALAMGAEIGARFNLSERMYDGFDPTGIAGVFAATATAGRLMQLTETQMVHALALAFNRCGGSFQSHVDGSLAVRLVQGFVAETGVWCAQMARAGLTGPHHFINGHYGFRHLYARGLRDADSFTQGLGQRWLLETIVFKKYPSCGVTQGVTHQALDLVDALQVNAGNFAQAEVRMPPYACKLVGSPFELGGNPRVNAQFSAQYCVANVVLRGASRLEHFRPEAIRDPALLPLIAKVRIVPDAAMDARGHSAVDLRITRSDGQSQSRSYDVSPGFPGRGLSDSEHRIRFDDCLAYAPHPLNAAQADATLAAIQGLAELPDVLPMWRTLCRAGAA